MSVKTDRGIFEKELKAERRRGSERRSKARMANDKAEGASQDRRKQIDPTTCERDYGLEEVAFMKAMDDYKRKSGRQFPTWSEVLEVLHALGYRKVAEVTAIDHAKRHNP